MSVRLRSVAHDSDEKAHLIFRSIKIPVETDPLAKEHVKKEKLQIKKKLMALDQRMEANLLKQLQMPQQSEALEKERKEMNLEAVQLNLLGLNATLKEKGHNFVVEAAPGESMVPEAKLEKFHKQTHQRFDAQGRPEKICPVCAQLENPKRCVKCSFVYYCGKTHQKMHWKMHQLRCDQIRLKSTAYCCHCKKACNVWVDDVYCNGRNPYDSDFDPDKHKHATFSCDTCRNKDETHKLLHPRQVWAVVGSVLTQEKADNIVKEHQDEENVVLPIDI